MKKSILELSKDQIRFLLNLKMSMTKLNNRIHDTLALIAIEQFRQKYPQLNFEYKNAGTKGIDIKAFDPSDLEHPRLIAEVKTTTISPKKSLQGAQKEKIEADFERLTQFPGSPDRFLIVLEAKTKDQIIKQIKTAERFSMVRSPMQISLSRRFFVRMLGRSHE